MRARIPSKFHISRYSNYAEAEASKSRRSRAAHVSNQQPRMSARNVSDKSTLDGMAANSSGISPKPFTDGGPSLSWGVKRNQSAPQTKAIIERRSTQGLRLKLLEMEPVSQSVLSGGGRWNCRSDMTG